MHAETNPVHKNRKSQKTPYQKRKNTPTEGKTPGTPPEGCPLLTRFCHKESDAHCNPRIVKILLPSAWVHFLCRLLLIAHQAQRGSYLSSCHFFFHLHFQFHCQSRLLLRLPFRFRCRFRLGFRFRYGPSCRAHGVTNSSRYMFTKQAGLGKTTHEQTTMMLHSHNKMPPPAVVVTE